MKHYAYDQIMIMIMIRSDTYIYTYVYMYRILIYSATHIKALEIMQCPSYPTGDDVHVHT